MSAPSTLVFAPIAPPTTLYRQQLRYFTADGRRYYAPILALKAAAETVGVCFPCAARGELMLYTISRPGVGIGRKHMQQCHPECDACEKLPSEESVLRFLDHQMRLALVHQPTPASPKEWWDALFDAFLRMLYVYVAGRVRVDTSRVDREVAVGKMLIDVYTESPLAAVENLFVILGVGAAQDDGGFRMQTDELQGILDLANPTITHEILARLVYIEPVHSLVHLYAMVRKLHSKPPNIQWRAQREIEYFTQIICAYRV